MRLPAKSTSQRSNVTPIAIGVLATGCAITSAAIWAMHLLSSSAGVPAHSKPIVASGAGEVANESSSSDALARLFGAPVTDNSGRGVEGVQLQGIVGDRQGKGVVLLSIDGAPPIRVRVGGQVRSGLKLVEIQRKHVLLEQNGKTLELALVTRAASQSTAGSPSSLPPAIPGLNAATPATSTAPATR